MRAMSAACSVCETLLERRAVSIERETPMRAVAKVEPSSIARIGRRSPGSEEGMTFSNSRLLATGMIMPVSEATSVAKATRR